MTQELTDTQRIKASITLWRWMAAKKGRWKGDWPGWKKYKTQRFYCFLCTRFHEEQYPICQNCPLLKEDMSCVGLRSLYSGWSNAYNINGDTCIPARRVYNALRRALRKAENEI